MAVLDALDMTLIAEVAAPLLTPVGIHNRYDCIKVKRGTRSDSNSSTD